MRVQHRHIIYIQGYDPRGLAQYYRMFRTELRKFGRLYQLQATISRPKVAADDEIASWTIDTKAEDWQTRTAYDFLRFEDFIQQDLASPIWRTVFSAVWIYWRLVFAGTIARFGKANWRFATFITYPHLMLLLEAACAAAIAFVFEKGLNALGIPDIFSIAIATAMFVALLGTVLKYTENATYVLYLLCDTIWTWEFSRRERPEWDQRIDRFAQHLVNVARSTDAEEIVIVGHSSGIVPAHGNAGARAEARSCARPSRSADRAADDRRQFPDRRLSRRGASSSATICAAGDRAVDRLDRLPGPQGRDEFLPVRSDHEPRHRRRRRQAQSDRSCRSASATSSGPSTTRSFAGSSSACISSS